MLFIKLIQRLALHCFLAALQEILRKLSSVKVRATEFQKANQPSILEQSAEHEKTYGWGLTNFSRKDSLHNINQDLWPLESAKWVTKQPIH